MPSMSTIESLFCRSTPWEAATRRWVLPWALQGVRPTGRVLEIGGGGGAMAAQLLAASAPADQVQLTVTDFDPVMVAAAQDRLQRFGDRAQARVADAAALPFGDDEFDTVVSFIMLHHVVDWEQALREAVRVLRPGGVLLMNSPDEPGLRHLVRVAAGLRSAVGPGGEVAAVAMRDVVKGRRFGNVVLVGSRAPLDVEEVRRQLRRWPFPSGVLGPGELSRRAGGSSPIRDGEATPSPVAPEAGAWRAR